MVRSLLKQWLIIRVPQMKVNISPFKNGSSYRKVDIRIEDHDTHSLDHTLAMIIYPALLQLREAKHGIPIEFADVGGEEYSTQDSFEFYKETNAESFDAATKKWDDTLDKIIWAFQQLADEDYDSKYHHGDVKFVWKKTNELVYNPITGKKEETFEMLDSNPTEHWYDAEGHILHEKRIQEGLSLFGKYFRSLWD